MFNSCVGETLICYETHLILSLPGQGSQVVVKRVIPVGIILLADGIAAEVIEKRFSGDKGVFVMS